MIEPDQIDTLLELARREAARRGHSSRPDLGHLAHVMANRFPESFDRSFGRFGRVVLEGVLRSGTSIGALAEGTAILRWSESIDDAIRGLRDHLALPEVLTEEMEPESHGRWLVAHIEDRFRAYDWEPDAQLLDELYVLVATLKVTGITEPYEAMRRRLSALPK